MRHQATRRRHGSNGWDFQEDGQALRELAARLLTLDIEDGQATAGPTIFAGGLPEDLPVETTLPDEARVVGSVTREISRNRRSTDIVLDISLPAERFRDVYRQQLLAAGWEEDEELFGRRGFVPPGLFHRAASRSARLRRLLRGRVPSLHRLFPVVFRTGGTRLMGSAYDRAGAPTDVRLHLLAARRKPWVNRDTAWEILPVLNPPLDVRRRPEVQNLGVLAPPFDARQTGATKAEEDASATMTAHTPTSPSKPASTSPPSLPTTPRNSKRPVGPASMGSKMGHKPGAPGLTPAAMATCGQALSPPCGYYPEGQPATSCKYTLAGPEILPGKATGRGYIPAPALTRLKN